MYRRQVSMLRPGDVLARTLYTERGDVLLGAGTTLTQFYITKLAERDIISVFLQDGLGDDIEPNDIISTELRSSTVTHLARAFDVIGSMANGARQDLGNKPRTVNDLVNRLGEKPLELPQQGADALQHLYRDIESLMNEILESNTMASLESLKTHNDYTFQHSVDVAVLGILLGRTAGLPRDQLRELALGCLLHDLGKMYIDEAILDKPGRLEPEEFEEIKKHPQMGFELIRRMPVFSILPAHVAYQHHERQDGSGYPRGLIGDNRITRTLGERMDPRRMLLIAEIGAVADVYSALTSDRPYRPAMSLDRVTRIISEMAGPHLNSDVVTMLQHSVPQYPVGHWVEIVSGKYRGWRGVVTRNAMEALHRPHIRILLDDRAHRVPNPIEIDLRVQEDVKVRGLAPHEAPHEIAVAV